MKFISALIFLFLVYLLGRCTFWVHKGITIGKISGIELIIYCVILIASSVYLVLNLIS